jgi:hypothetical protein
MDVRPVVHLLLHAVVPFALARWAWPARWRRAFLVLTATMLVDLDHLLSDPIYAPDRCSIGHHPLHTLPAIGVYVALLAVRRSRLVALGLVVHMGLDLLDCAWMSWER